MTYTSLMISHLPNEEGWHEKIVVKDRYGINAEDQRVSWYSTL
jgi:hypothetical protein